MMRKRSKQELTALIAIWRMPDIHHEKGSLRSTPEPGLKNRFPYTHGMSVMTPDQVS